MIAKRHQDTLYTPAIKIWEKYFLILPRVQGAPMGPLWIDLDSYTLSAEEKELLEHPTVGGVILFSRNYHDSDQLLALNKSIRKAAKRPLLIGVDQEGGRVQRFKDSFSPIPPAKAYAHFNEGETLAKQAGWLMAIELIAHDIDLSFAPVLDRGFMCSAITSRAFGEDNDTVIRFSSAFMAGMKQAGMATTGKHFPGHGAVTADSHHESPKDERQDLFEQDMAIFTAHIKHGLLDAMMPAHVIYPHYDQAPASGSHYWLQTVLRQQLGFKGIIFSDDLNMQGASVMGSAVERAEQSLDAGCDMLLFCNNRAASIEVIDQLKPSKMPNATPLLKRQEMTIKALKQNSDWKEVRQAVINCHHAWLDKEK